MRLTVTAAVALALAAAPASAASLKGKAFAIDKSTSNEQVFANAFQTPAGFAVGLAEDKGGDDSPETISLVPFKANGKPDGKKAFVAEGKPNQVKLVFATPAGGLSLTGGKALVAYSDLRTISLTASGGLFGQVMDGGKRDGKEIAIDSEEKAGVVFGSLIPVADGGFATWTTYDFLSRKNGAAGRFVSKAGKLDDAIVDLTRPGSQFSGAQPFRDGFIAQWLEIDARNKKGAVFARIYDGDGKPVGAEAALTETDAVQKVVFTAPVGLSDGKIVVLRSVKKGASAQLEGQLYDGEWKKIGKSKVLIKATVTQAFNAQPLPGGDFLVGVKLKDGAKGVAIGYARFAQTLKSVGGTARISPIAKPEMTQLLALESGDVLALYSSAGKKLTGQLIKP